MSTLQQRSGRHRRATRLTAILAIPVIAGSFVVATSPLAGATPAPEPAVPTFVDGLSQAVFTKTSSQWIRQELWVEAPIDSDGDGLNDLVHVDVTRVPETNTDNLKVPVIMELSPYYAGIRSTPNWSVDHEIGSPPATRGATPTYKLPTNSPKISTIYESTWVPRGFAVVHAESLGSGYSEGCPTSGAPNETIGGKAVIDWLGGRATGYTSRDRTTTVDATWFNGHAGMMGTSYNGTLPIAVASTGVQGLDAIVPISAISSWYDYYRANGAVRAPGGYQGEDLDVLAEAVYTRFDRSICQPFIDQQKIDEDRVTGDYSAYWDERNYLNNADKIHAATLVAHGLNDWNVMTKNAAALYETLKANGVPHQIYLHQGGHGGSPNDTLLNRWFTKYLYGVDNGVQNRPKAYIVRENNALTEYPEWPDPAAAKTTFKLSSVAGQPSATGLLSFVTDSTGATQTLTDDATKKVATLAAAATSPNRLLYITPALGSALRLSGTPTVSLNLAVDRDKANLTAVLLEYPATGNPKVITRGWMDVQNRNSPAVTDPITPGTSYQFNFDFQPKDYVFAAGKRIGLMVLSSDNEYTVRPAAGTQLTLDPAKSTVTLPMVGGPAAVAGAIGQPAPGNGYQILSAAVAGSALTLSSPTSSQAVTMGAAVLTGVDQTTTGTLNDVIVTDARGTAAGWGLTGQVGDFTSAAGTILADNLGWAPTAAVNTGALPVAPGEQMAVVAGASAAPGSGTGLAAPRTLCRSPYGSSAGTATCGGGLTLGIPGSTPVGNYSAVLTLTLI